MICDGLPPAISDINVTPAKVTAIINWTTSENANSTVHYSTNQSDLNLTESSSTLTTAHSITLTGLTASTMYFYNITSCDKYANCNQTTIYNFTTLALQTPKITK